MTIFVSIASFMDPELTKTVDSLYSQADNPQDVFVGIVSQDVNNKHPEFKKKNIRQKNIYALDAKGAGYARKIAMELYDEEDFFFQIDSHSRFAKGWDTELVNILSHAQDIAGTNKVILSQFPAPYFVGSDGKDYFPENDPLYWSNPSWSKVVNHPSGHWGAVRQEILDMSKPHKSQTVLAGYIFAPGSIVNEIPYDERISFMGEELCFAIRAYTRNWEIYAPNKMLVWHFYERRGYKKVWSNHSRKNTWMNIEKESSRIQKDVLLGIERGTFGVEDYDRYYDYQEMIEIDFEEFYNSGVMKYKENMNVLVEEIFPDHSLINKAYCLNDAHAECDGKGCQCNCHKEK